MEQYFSDSTKRIEKNTDTEIKMGDYEKWFEMDVGIQLANVGGEICRAIRWKNRGDDKKEANFYNKAMEFLELTMQDPKNSHRRGELSEARYELEDFFYGGNTYDNTDESIMKYYDSFLSPPYSMRRKV